MDERRQRLLKNLNLSRQLGLEIGPMDRPVVSRDMGKVIYADRWSSEELTESGRDYSEYNLEDIHIDAVWRNRTLKKAIGEEMKVDYVIASHVVEHTADLVDWLKQIQDVLSAEGTLRLAVPDKRYIFDVLREVSRPSDVLAAYLEKRQWPSTQCLVDFLLFQSEWGGQEAWNTRGAPHVKPKRDIREALQQAQGYMKKPEEVDVHCWVFTPYSFACVMEALTRAELTKFGCDFYFPPAYMTNEFTVSLKPLASFHDASRTWAAMKDKEEASELAERSRELLVRLKGRGNGRARQDNSQHSQAEN